ncbi:hypothetical protein BC938DRAFT_472287 [Jimgerdemannia flammicorona]|uniref:UspA domain-containing protein n=1 Tax=Jimgerdemannia flammicorona TaxID=994334 RepID=A0A433Q6G8_9FUNG|nr:hypothetical protein BC938DRAFT_472287 [Jimgerdemannia flammicorona]
MSTPTPRKVLLAYDHSRNSDHAVDVCIAQNLIQKAELDHIIVVMVVNEELSHVYNSIELQAAHYGANWLAEDYDRRIKAVEMGAQGVVSDVVRKLKGLGVRIFFERLGLACERVRCRRGRNS